MTDQENPNTDQPDTRSGFVAIAGLPNVGKSTLMNSVLGQKVSIATSRPQTTRNRIIGIHTVAQRGQIAFVDTPGIHKPHKELNAVMVDTAIKSIADTELVLFVVDATNLLRRGALHSGIAHVAGVIAEMKLPTIVALNKIDRLKSNQELLPLLEACAKMGELEPLTTVPTSATEKTGLDVLVDQIFDQLPAGPNLYPDDMITDQAERFVAAEIIREKITLQTRKELPYSTAVVVEEFRDDGARKLLRIRGVVHVERESQKGMVIGKQGARLKQIGSQARGELERFFGQKVYLDLHVKVSKNWASNVARMRDLGYEKG